MQVLEKRGNLNMVKYKFTLSYIAAIVLVNMGFIYIPMIPILGEMFPPMSLVVGAVFILRDFAQREIGHKVLGAMLIGAGLSYIMADPFVAWASLVAFAISELVTSDRVQFLIVSNCLSLKYE